MPLNAVRRRAMSAAAGAIAAAALMSGSAMAEAGVPAAGCPAIPTVQPFGPWQDFADYFMAPGGDIEDGASTWDLAGDASAIEGNEPFNVGGPSDHRSLGLPAGTSATTATICVGAEHRTMRFFSRGAGAGVLHVDAIYARQTPREKSTRLGSIDGNGAWAPSPILPMIVNEDAAGHGNALPVVLRFTARGGDWQIDDVYVDPYRKG